MTLSQMEQNKKASENAKKIMLDKLCAQNAQDEDEDDSSDYSNEYVCDWKSMYQNEERKEIKQFYDNLFNFTPLLSFDCVIPLLFSTAFCWS